MVVALGPGKFYGSSLPRPRIYTDVKLNSERVDPPTPVLDPFFSWANEAHWSMGGLSFKRHRLQGRIEGSIKKLRAESEKIIRNKNRSASKESVKTGSVSPPPAPIVKKRRRYMALIDEDEEEEEVGEEKEIHVRRRPARKLGDDFDRVASENLNKRNVISKGSDDDSGLKKSVMGFKMKSSDGLNTVASRTRSRWFEEEDDGIDGVVMETVEKVKRSNKKSKKLKGGDKGKSDGENKGLSPSGGIRTSPRLSKRSLT